MLNQERNARQKQKPTMKAMEEQKKKNKSEDKGRKIFIFTRGSQVRGVGLLPLSTAKLTKKKNMKWVIAISAGWEGQQVCFIQRERERDVQKGEEHVGGRTSLPLFACYGRSGRLQYCICQQDKVPTSLQGNFEQFYAHVAQLVGPTSYEELESGSPAVSPRRFELYIGANILTVVF